MKKIISILLFLLFFVCNTSLASIFSDNFDSYSTGVLNTVASSDWFTYNNLSGGLQVRSSSPFSSPNYLGYGTNSRNVYYNQDISQYTDIWVMYDLKLTNNWIGTVNAFPMFNYNNVNGSESMTKLTISPLMIVNGSLQLYGKSSCAGSYGKVEDITGIGSISDLKVIIRFDLSVKAYKLYIDDYESSVYPLLDGNTNCLSGVTFPYLIGFPGNEQTTTVIDNLVIDVQNPLIINGVCGSLNGGSYSTLNIGAEDLCSSGTPYSEKFVVSGGYAWQCLGSDNGGATVSCSASYSPFSPAYETPPTDYPDVSTNEQTTSNWLIDTLKFVFLPSKETWERFLSLGSDLSSRIPFAYLPAIQNLFSSDNMGVTPDNIVFTLDLPEKYGLSSITFFDLNGLKEKIGSGVWDLFYGFMQLSIVFILLSGLYAKAKGAITGIDRAG